MSSPSSVRNPGMSHKFLIHIDLLFIDQFSQCRYFAHLFEKVNFILAVAVNSHSSRIVTTILEALKPCDTHVLEGSMRRVGGVYHQPKPLPNRPWTFRQDNSHIR